MKILFSGAFYKGSVVTLRAETIKELGNDVKLFNTHSYEAFGGRLVSYALRKTRLINVNYYLMNKNLLEYALETKPDIIWIDKGRHISGATLKRIRKKIKVTIVYDTLDYMFSPFNKTKQILSSIPEYDLIVTMRRDEDQYYSYGAKKVLRLWCCTYAPMYIQRKLTAKEKVLYSSEVSFVGTPEKDRAESIAFLIENGIDVKIWGHLRHWKKLKCFNKLKSHFTDSFLVWEDYAKALNGTKIGLCFLKRISRDEHTFRSIEIPASESFMIAERTRDHMELFEEDKEAVFFSDNKELLEKVRYYLANSEKREAIATAGRQRFLTSNYTFRWRYHKILEEIKSSIGDDSYGQKTDLS